MSGFARTSSAVRTSRLRTSFAGSAAMFDGAIGIRSRIRRFWPVSPLVTGLVASFTLESAIWECASMMPGMTNLPVTSMVVTSSGAERPRPMRAMRPSRTRMSVFSSVPAEETVMTVPPLSRTSPRSWARAVETAAGAVASAKVAPRKRRTNRMGDRASWRFVRVGKAVCMGVTGSGGSTHCRRRPRRHEPGARRVRTSRRPRPRASRGSSRRTSRRR